MRKRPGLNPKIYVPLILLLAAGNLALVIMYALPSSQSLDQPVSPSISAAPVTPSPSAKSSLIQPSTPQPVPSPVMLPTQPVLNQAGLRQQGAFILSLSDGLNIHLFAYHPQNFPLTRLTNSPWDDRNPVVSPDGTKIAFSSRQNGYSDLYILSLADGKITRASDTPEFEGSPSWSPDGQWLAAERLIFNTIQIVLLPLDPATSPVQLTTNPDAASYSPTWSPQGREVAFVSTQNGKEDVWLARLDRIDDRFINLSQSIPGNHSAPRWSPDGNMLAWSNETDQGSMIRLWSEQKPDQQAHILAPGESPAWDSSGTIILAQIRQPNQTGITTYRVSDGLEMMPLTWLPGALHGIDWLSGTAAEALLNSSLSVESRQPVKPLWQVKTGALTPAPAGRSALVSLQDVIAPYPYLQDSIDDSFTALREETGRQVGWDFLANLENAYNPLTTASSPDMNENWLYSGRAIAVNSQPMPAGWMSVVREAINGQTYWRVFLRARFQDGSQGIPLTRPIWDLDARSSGNPEVYEEGGQLGPIPQGYWVDFTDLAARFGWERQPSLVNWRTYYPGIRFNVFIQRSGLDWKSAMAQLYPPEALATPTSFITATITPSPTRTPWYYLYLTQSITPSITPSPTLRPTLTPPGTPPAP